MAINFRLKRELDRIVGAGFLTIAQVDDLLGIDWEKLVSELPREVANDAMVEYHFLKGMKDEFEDGFWDGNHDAEMMSRLTTLLSRLS